MKTNSTFYFLFSRFWLILLLATFYFLISSPVFAAQIFFDAQNTELAIDQEFQIDVLLNTEGESINAAEGIIIFPDDLLVFAGVKDGNSVINFWVEEPALKTRDKIVFSGIVPGGYAGERGLLFSLVFKAHKEGRGAIALRDVRALKNDGLGAAAEASISNFKFVITHETARIRTLTDAKDDGEPPEGFRPEIARDETLFEGKWFLVFATQDKNLGIDHYEVREGFWGKFIRARSPYLLLNQNLDKKIFVKAVDKTGNERGEALYPSNYKSWYQTYWILGIMIIAAVMYLIWKILWRK